MDEKVTFTASFPSIQSAIKIDGGGNGARIQLDIPEIELYNASPCFNWRRSALKVTIEQVSVKQDESDGQMEIGTVRQSGWTPPQE